MVSTGTFFFTKKPCQKLTLAHGQQDATAVQWQTWLSLALVVGLLVIKPKST